MDVDSPETWSLDVINAYCQEHFKGDFMCEMAEGKGRIMVAKKDVPQGEILFCEPPLHIVCEDENNDAFLAVKALCEEHGDDFDYEPLWYWTALCSLTQEQLRGGPQVGTLEPIEELQQKRLISLYHEPVSEAGDAVTKICDKIGLQTDPALVEELLQAWILNCFEHSEDPLGYSAYFASSFVSHSCGPNAIWTEGDDGLHILRAREPIKAGMEVTISYLEEHVLLHSAEARKKVLQSTKLFECTCERCGPSVTPDDNPGVDHCRGFHCKSCGAHEVFHRLGRVKGKGKGKGGQALIACRNCGVQIDAKECKRLLQAESTLEEKLQKLDDELEKYSVQRALDEQRINSLTRHVDNDEEGPVGPQHWLCDRLWEHLHNFYEAQGRRADQRHVVELRVTYQRKAYPGLSAHLAWTLERQADMLLRHLGFGQAMSESDKSQEQEMTATVMQAFEDSKRILMLMFGREHEHFTSVDTKQQNALKFFEKKKKGNADGYAKEKL